MVQGSGIIICSSLQMEPGHKFVGWLRFKTFLCLRVALGRYRSSADTIECSSPPNLEATFLALSCERQIKECQKNALNSEVARAKMSVLRRKSAYSSMHTLARILVIPDREPIHALGAFARRS
jgi:hypothetical protein